MRALVTGVAGFIGSHLGERLVAEGWEVLGLDCFTPYYPRATKWTNLERLRHLPRFQLVDDDLRTAELGQRVGGVDVIVHLAAQPGVRLSWADGFHAYSAHNVDATQRLLEAARSAPATPRVVFASSSSVYGEVDDSSCTEDAPLRPHSPYGVTKVAGELLIAAYVANFGLDAVSLRFFSVYGPRQRPDMALHRMIEAAIDRQAFPLYGDGTSRRDFTYVDDVVEACYRAATTPVLPGTVLNVAGGATTSVNELLGLVGDALGTEVPVEHHPAEAGDVTLTSGAIDRAGALLGWKPSMSLREGVARQVEWYRSRRGLRR
jgi:nucleoside-diphosphate-sugar epimerase